MYKELVNQFITGSMERNVVLKSWKAANKKFFKTENEVAKTIERLSEHGYIRISGDKKGSKLHFNPLAKRLT